MPGKLTSKSAIIVGGTTAVAIGAISMAMVMGPANADDLTASPSTSASATDAPSVDGPRGPRGGHGPMGMDPALASIGTVLIKTETFKAADGTLTVVRRQAGDVTAVSASSITLKTSSIERTYAITADTVVMGGAVTDIKVGDQVAIEATVSGDTATATEIHSRPAAPVDAPAGSPADGPDGDMGHGHGGPDGRGDHGHGPGGDMGRGGPGGPGAEAAYGVEISEELLVERADGSIITVNEVEGTVVSVSGSTITLKNANGDTVSYDVPASVTPERNRAAAALSDFVAGDDVHVLVEVNGGTETVLAVHGHDANAMDGGPHGGPQDSASGDVAALPSDSNNA